MIYFRLSRRDRLAYFWRYNWDWLTGLLLTLVALVAGTRRARLWAWLRAHEVEALAVFALAVFLVVVIGGER